MPGCKANSPLNSQGYLGYKHVHLRLCWSCLFEVWFSRFDPMQQMIKHDITEVWTIADWFKMLACATFKILRSWVRLLTLVMCTSHKTDLMCLASNNCTRSTARQTVMRYYSSSFMHIHYQGRWEYLSWVPIHIYILVWLIFCVCVFSGPHSTSGRDWHEPLYRRIWRWERNNACLLHRRGYTRHKHVHQGDSEGWDHTVSANSQHFSSVPFQGLYLKHHASDYFKHKSFK